jgi:Uma2 family endonuclease
MSTVLDTPAAHEQAIHYPESDGQPMADNTLQFQWIVLIKENLETLFRDRPDVFVAGDLFWYPVEGRRDMCRAPDAMVVFGRPKGYRGSYKQWEEDGIAPQVVFEVLSPGNKVSEMARKFQFYNEHQVEEYYVYDPDEDDLIGWLRQDDQLRVIDEMNGWTSPRLGIRFDMSGEELRIFAPDGTPFRSHQEVVEWAMERDKRAAQAEQRAARLAERLRELGIEPEDA